MTVVLEAADAWLPARMEAVEERLRRLVEGHGEALAADADATLAAGGKRLRPMLVLLSAGPGAGEAAIRAATAIELVHMATLVHDDVLDAAPLRRGPPDRGRALGAPPGAGGRRPAVLAGVRRAGAATVPRSQVELLSRAPPWRSRSASSPSGATPSTSRSPRERYLERCELKTARLFECACLIGQARTPSRRRGSPCAPVFGREIGLAFQLLDDVLDVTGPPERTGKARGTDLLDGTVTLPLILARERDGSLAGARPASASTPREPSRSATGSPPPASLDEVSAGARRRVELAKRALERSRRSKPSSASSWSWSPTASWSAI